MKKIVCLFVWLFVYSTANATLIGTNIIVNGDAESDPGSMSGNDIISPITGWTTSGNFTVVEYDASGGFPGMSSPGPTDRGENFFAGGPSNASSSATQMIDISADALLIDAGGVQFALEAFLGGFFSQNDQAVLFITFLDSIGGSLGMSSIGPVVGAERGDITGLLARSTNGALPVGTRDIGVLLEMTRMAGIYNDGYADNLSLVLSVSDNVPSPVPEPATLALFGIGLAGLGFARKKRKSA